MSLETFKITLYFQKILSLNRSSSVEFTEDDAEDIEEGISNLVYELCGTLQELEDVDREVRYQLNLQ